MIRCLATLVCTSKNFCNDYFLKVNSTFHGAKPTKQQLPCEVTHCAQYTGWPKNVATKLSINCITAFRVKILKILHFSSDQSVYNSAIIILNAWSNTWHQVYCAWSA